MKIYRGIRWENNFHEEVQLSNALGYEGLQIWYYKGALNISCEDKLRTLKEIDHNIIIHAVWTADEINSDGHKLIKILLDLGHKELIVHPVLDGPRSQRSIFELEGALLALSRSLKKHDILLFVENNSMIDDINHRLDDMKIIYKHDDIHLLLDIAHISSYDHLNRILEIRKPEMLHLADKRFHIDHEHLPLGEGQLDFDYIFKECLIDFDGKIILEVAGTDDDLKKSYDKLLQIIN